MQGLFLCIHQTAQHNLIRSTVIFIFYNITVFLFDPEYNAAMRKNELVEGCTRVVPVLKHAKVVLHVCVSDVKSAALQIAIVRVALISQGMSRTS